MRRLTYCLLVVALVGLGALPLARLQAGGEGTRYAFLVACSDYDEDHLKKLPFTVKEMAEFRDVLLATGVAPNNIKFLRDGAQDFRFIPTKAHIEKELELLLNRVKANDTVLVVLNGHGLQFKGDKSGFFCPLGAEVLKRETMLPMDAVFAQLQGCKAKRKLLIINACRNDPLSETSQAAKKVTLVDSYEEVPEGIAALYACQQTERSYYYDPKHPKTSGRARSIFMHHLIEAWQGKYTAGGKVTLEEVIRHVTQKTVDDADVFRGQKQTPTVMRAYQGEWVLAKAVKAALAKQLELELGGGVKLQVVRIEPGTFQMGSPANEVERGSDELQHTVEITRPYYMGVYTVTQAQYQQVMGQNPSKFKGDELPVETVSWHEAQEFCVKVSALAGVKALGLVADLPTEAEWEYACRAGTQTVFHYGNALSSKQANFDGDSPYGGADKGPNLYRTAKVGTFLPNAWGLYECTAMLTSGARTGMVTTKTTTKKTRKDRIMAVVVFHAAVPGTTQPGTAGPRIASTESHPRTASSL